MCGAFPPVTAESPMTENAVAMGGVEQCRRNPHLVNGSTIPQHTGEGGVDPTFCGCLGEGLNLALCLLSFEGDDG